MENIENLKISSLTKYNQYTCTTEPSEIHDAK